jgi:hypothetical protein
MSLEGWIGLALSTLILGLNLWAIVDCAIRPAPAFVAAGKLDKQKWLLITIGAFVAPFLIPFIGVLAVVGSIVYLVDVRPAIREVQSGGRW